jgi:hypothetical protein
VDSEDKKFETPDEVAAQEQSVEPRIGTGAEDSSFKSKALEDNEIMSRKAKSKWNVFNHLNWPPGKKEWAIFIIILLLLIGGGVAYAMTHKQPDTLKPIPKVTDASKTVPSTLTGLPVDPGVNKRTVTGVMIENSTWARPQSGLSQAGVVFEAIAEAGITRFLALYQDTAPKSVGPIRSARPYFIRWNQAFDAGYAHVGGSPEALADIKRWHIRDLNQFYSPNYFHRINSRAAPHNVYTGIPTLNQLEVSKGYKTSKYTGFARKKKAFRPQNQPITARSINFNISSAEYHVHYTYDPKYNSYIRSEGGAPHIDANGNKRVRPVVVVALVMHYNLERDGYHSNYGAIGSGRALIFQDGKIIKAIWVKKSNASQLTFKDSTGKTVPLNPGQTWLTAVSGENQVAYAAK